MTFQEKARGGEGYLLEENPRQRKQLAWCIQGIADKACIAGVSAGESDTETPKGLIMQSLVGRPRSLVFTLIRWVLSRHLIGLRF